MNAVISGWVPQWEWIILSALLCRGSESKQDERDCGTSQSNTIQQSSVRPARCPLPLSFHSQCFLAGTESRNVRLLWADLLGCERLVLLLLLDVQLMIGQPALQCNAVYWLIVVPAVQRRGFIPWRPSKAWPPLPVWGANGYQMVGEEKGGGGLVLPAPLILCSFCLWLVIFRYILNFSLAKAFILHIFIKSKS